MVKPLQLKPLNFSLPLFCVRGKFWLDRKGRWVGGGGREDVGQRGGRQKCMGERSLTGQPGLFMGV